MKINHYGEVLIGCVYCNSWGRPGDENLIMELLGDDLEALKACLALRCELGRAAHALLYVGRQGRR